MLRCHPLKFIRKKNMETANKTSRQEILHYNFTISPKCEKSFSEPSIPVGYQNEFALEGVFNHALFLFFRQPLSLRKILVRSQIPSPLTSTGNSPCSKPRFQIRPHFCTSFPVLLYFIHRSSNTVYVLLCNKCTGGINVGETRAKFRLRLQTSNTLIYNNLEHFS